MSITPEKFNQLATKDDIKNSEEKIRKDVNKVLTAVDGIAKKYETTELELMSNQVAHDRFEERFVEIENDIKVVKEKVMVS